MLGFVNVDRCTGGMADWNQQGYANEISDEEGAFRLLGSGGVAIDGRDATDYDAGHIAGASNVTFAAILADAPGAMTGVESDARILLYGAGGAQATEYQAAAALEAAGFTNVSYFSAGYAAWVAAGWPTE